MSKYLLSKIKGFTVVEIIVVLSVIGVVTLLTVPTYKPGNRSFALKAAAEQLIDDVEKAKTEALAGTYHNLDDKPDSWGVIIKNRNTPNYEIYVDKTISYQYTGPGTTPSGPEESIELKTLPFDIVISDFSDAETFLDLNFEFLLGNFRKNQNIGIPDSVTWIELTDPQSGNTLVLEINQTGVVGSVGPAVCGNGLIEVGEDCEPPGALGVTTCEEISPVFEGQSTALNCGGDCTLEGGNITLKCIVPPLPPPTGGASVCGNGILEQDESCDTGPGHNFCCNNCRIGSGCVCDYSTEPNQCRRIGNYLGPGTGITFGGGGGGFSLINLGGFLSGFGSLSFGGFGLGGLGISIGGFCYALPEEQMGSNMVLSSLFALMLLMAVPTVMVFTVYRYKFAHNKNND